MVPVKDDASANLNLHQTGLAPKLTEADGPSPTSRIDNHRCLVYLYQRIERLSQPSRGDQVVASQSRHICDAVKCEFSRRALETFVSMIH